jgi:hypothetical protein
VFGGTAHSQPGGKGVLPGGKGGLPGGKKGPPGGIGDLPGDIGDPFTIQTRVFVPKHTDAAEVLRAMQLFLERAAPVRADFAGGAMPPGGVGGGGPPPGGGSTKGPGGFRPGGGGFGGPPGTFPPGAETRLSLDRRTGSILVRGTASDLGLAADLVKVLDAPADEPLPEVKSLRAFQLKHASATALAEHAARLDLHVAAVGLDEAKLLLVTGFPDGVQEVAQLVKTLDVPAPKGLENRRKLFAPVKRVDP